MLSSEEAISKLKLIAPDRNPEKIITYNNLYLIFAPSSDPDEGMWDPYFSVDMTTGETRDYSIYQDGKAREIVSMFKSAALIERR
jgi:hypothetical protein